MPVNKLNKFYGFNKWWAGYSDRSLCHTPNIAEIARDAYNNGFEKAIVSNVVKKTKTNKPRPKRLKK